MRKYLRGCLIGAVVLIGGAGVALLTVYQAARYEPTFYREALTTEPQQLAVAGDELEQDVLELRNETHGEGEWEAVFTDQEINGWLASDLPEKFPDWLPDGVESPRVQIAKGEVNIAARYQDKVINSVISIVLDVALTDEPNTLAVTIQRLRAGAIPIPTRQFLDRISAAAQRGDVPLRWAQEGEHPVALITLPQHGESDKRQIVLDTIELRDGEIYLAGRTEDRHEMAPATIAQHEPRPSSLRGQTEPSD